MYFEGFKGKEVEAFLKSREGKNVTVQTVLGKKGSTDFIKIITIGQSPRIDITQNIKDILNRDITIIEVVVLDKYTYEEVLKEFSPNDNEDILASRMRDGTQVMLTKEKVSNELQILN